MKYKKVVVLLILWIWSLTFEVKALCQRTFAKSPLSEALRWRPIIIWLLYLISIFWKYIQVFPIVKGAMVHFSILFWLMPDNFIQQKERVLIIFKLLQKDAFDHMMCCVQHAISCVNLYAIFKEYNALLFHWKVHSMLVNVLNSTYYTTNSVV